jgi:predicted  nucleic acid-binding Zn-ribbon protein
MELDRILQNVESRLVRVGHALWKPDPKATLREEADLLNEELHDRCDALEVAKAERSALERRLRETKNAIDVLMGHIQTCVACGHGAPAWQFALQLDGLRQTLAKDQARLPQIEQVCWSVQFQVRQLERRLARVQEKIDA